MVRLLHQAIFGGSAIGVVLGLTAAVVPPWEFSGPGEQLMDYAKLGLLLVIGGIVTLIALLALRIYRRLDGTTPPELRAQVQVLSGEIVRTRGEVTKLGAEFGQQRAAIEALRNEVREVHAKMRDMTMIPCEECPVAKDQREDKRSAGFRKVAPSKFGRQE